jgi:AP endonuclease 1
MVRSSPRKAKQQAVEVAKSETVSTITTGTPGKKVAVTKTKVESAKTAVKRKSNPDYEDECESHAEEEVEKRPAAKKPRTKAKQNGAAATMPLAERTAVGSLKKAMYLGAHVSAAGGSSCFSSRPSLLTR